MPLLKIIFFCFCLCISANAAFSQSQTPDFITDQYRAVLWSKSDGLSDDILNVMIKDVKGFLWIASDDNGKLTRFDGMNFKKYTLDPKKPINATGKIMALKEDSLHNIWIGTYTGVTRYDLQSDTFTNFPASNNPAPAGWEQTSIPICATRDEMICLESGTTIVTYNIHSLARKKLLTIPKAYDLNWGYASTYSIFDAASNSLWMLPAGGEGLIQISLSNYKIARYTRPNYKDGPVSGQKNAEAMCYDKRRHCIWINSHDGLEKFSLKDEQFHHVDAMNEYVRMKDYTRYVGIDIDKNGRIWFATHPKGILVYIPETDRVQQVFSDPELIRKTGEFNLHIYCDRDGIVWTSYWGQSGMYSLLPFSKTVTHYNAKPEAKDSLSNGIIHSVVVASKGKIWIGTEDGLNIFDPKTEKFDVFRDKDLPGIKGKVIIPLHIDTIRQIAWLCAGSANRFNIAGMVIYEMNIVSRKCRPVVFKSGEKIFDQFGLIPAEIKPFKNGFLFIDDRYGVFYVKAENPIAELVAPFDYHTISKMLLEEDRFLFLRTNNFKALNLNYENRNGKWEQIPHVLDSMEYISMIYNEKDKTHWVSFSTELVQFDKDFNKIKTYRREEGYTSEIFNMVLDHSGNLWFINNLNQVGRLDIESGKISTLSEEDGFHKKEFGTSAPITKDAGGNLYFGTGLESIDGNRGLDRIYPERYVSSSISTAYLRSLSINQKPYSANTEVNSIDALSLAYDQNTISIAAGTIDFYSKGKNHIRYKLEEAGKEKGWEYPTDYMIRLDGLSPGEYRLMIQASNAGNQFNGSEKIIKITINPPFWETWWFRSSALVVGLLLVFGIFQYRSRNLRRRNDELEEKVMTRTRELKHSLEDLRETQTQLIQKEKMASLGELTAGIAHEIQNPLNFVNNFSELNVELLDELKEGPLKNLPEADQRNASSLLNGISENLDRIIHHGKRADAIVKGMLQHSRASTGKKEPTDINALADEYLRLAYQGFRSKDKAFKVILNTDFDPAIGEINIIPQDISRVLLNLYNNSFYAVSEKKKLQPEAYEPTVSITTKKIDGKIEVGVRDNGMGIPQKVFDKIFQPFFTTKPTGQGTGLGLSLSYDIIKSHGGEIKVNTKELEFTEFVIQLPIS